MDCGGRLVYYPTLSNPKAPNEHRILVYACPDCSHDFNKPKLISIRRNFENDPLESVEILITEERKKLEKSNKIDKQKEKLNGTISTNGT